MVSTILKNMKVDGEDDIPYMKWKIKAMFPTTNQLGICVASFTMFSIVQRASFAAPHRTLRGNHFK